MLWGLALLADAAVFAAVWWLCQAELDISSSDAIGIAGVAAALAGAPLAWWAGRERVLPSTQAGLTQVWPPIVSAAELIIGLDGHFVGGDEENTGRTPTLVRLGVVMTYVRGTSQKQSRW